MGKAIVSGGAITAVPVAGTRLSEFAEGSIVKLNESGSPVEFYVAKHDYESGLNGAGRTLLVRKASAFLRDFNGGVSNAYSGCRLDQYLIETYFPLLDPEIRQAVGETTFYYTVGNGNYTVTTLARSIFVLSVTELGLSASYAKVEGSALPIAGLLRTNNQHTRTPSTSDAKHSCQVINGTVYSQNTSLGRECFPAFTLPAAVKVAEDGTIKL